MFEGLRSRRVVALPDLFVDILVRQPPWPEARAAMDEVATRGGGNVPIPEPEIRLGGNAMNLAGAISNLGAQTALIAETDSIGHALLAQAYPRLDARCVRRGRVATTMALECPDANIMLSHSGPVADASVGSFGPGARDILADADAVAVVNWSATRNGSKLLRDVRDAAPDAWLYMDTGDLARRAQEVPKLLAAVRAAEVDVWAMNESEANIVSRIAKKSVRDLARDLRLRIDVHTRRKATSYTDDVISVPAQKVPGTQSTGAGDHWNAGNLAGDLLGLSTEHRLRLAHDVATAHVTGAAIHHELPIL